MGKMVFLFTGDIKAHAEKELVDIAGRGLQSTVMLAPHHGSRFSSTPEFLDRVDPEIVLISAGWENVYHFPHPTVLKKYEKRGFRVFRTDHHGAITVTTDGNDIDVRTVVEASGV